MLDELILHPRSRQLVDKLIAHLPHGLVVEGPDGIGALTVAKAIVQAVNSPEFVIQPKKKLKGVAIVNETEGSVLIEDIRLLYGQTRTRQPSTQVYIIDTGNKSMTLGAQNAFLKLLEEPRVGLHFIIVTHHVDQLLPTILSRSQRLSLLPVSKAQTEELIGSLNITDDTKKARLAFVGAGLPALIKRLATNESLYETRVSIMRDAKTLISGNAYEKLTVIHRYRDKRPESLTLLDDMSHQLHTVLRSQPDERLAANIARHLKTRERISAGGNIRLHLTSDVL